MSNKKAVAKGFKAPKQTVDQVVDTTVDQVVDTTVEELAEAPVEVKVKKVRPVTITKENIAEYLADKGVKNIALAIKLIDAYDSNDLTTSTEIILNKFKNLR